MIKVYLEKLTTESLFTLQIRMPNVTSTAHTTGARTYAKSTYRCNGTSGDVVMCNAMEA